MTTRFITTTAIGAFVATIGFGQMTTYSRPKASPTPTPTPKPRTGTIQAQRQTWPQKPAPTTPPRLSTVPLRSVQSIPTATPMRPQFPQAAHTTTANGQAPLRSAQSVPAPTPAFVQATPAPVPAPDVKLYLDRQVGSSQDGKFHLTVNAKDLALTPFHVWRQKSTGFNTTSTCVDMRSADGRVYDIDFLTTGNQVTGLKIHKINGETLR